MKTRVLRFRSLQVGSLLALLTAWLLLAALPRDVMARTTKAESVEEKSISTKAKTFSKTKTTAEAKTAKDKVAKSKAEKSKDKLKGKSKEKEAKSEKRAAKMTAKERVQNKAQNKAQQKADKLATKSKDTKVKTRSAEFAAEVSPRRSADGSLRSGMLKMGTSAPLLAQLGVASGTSTPNQSAVKPPVFAPPPALGYQDKVMSVDPLERVDEEPKNTYNANGLPRSWSVETSTDIRNAGGIQNSATGLRLNGYTDTLHYGGLSGNLSLQQQNAASANSSLVLRQIGMPFNGGWRLDNALGMVNLPMVDLARNSQRITLTTPSMMGVASTLRQSGLGLLAATGRAGQFTGYPVPGFTLNDGTYNLAGITKELKNSGGGAWKLGGMVASAQNVSSVLAQTPGGPGRMNAQGLFVSAKREFATSPQWGEPYVQVNAVGSQNTGNDSAGLRNPAASGLWAEGGFGMGTHRNNWGVFRLDPSLAWLDLPMASDLQGGYWRHAWRTRQWSVESGIELLNSVSGTNPQGYFANNNLRYQYSSAMSFGASTSVRRYGVQSQALQLYSQFGNSLGNSRAQMDWASSDSGERLLRLQLDHDWAVVQALRLSTAVSVDSEQRPKGDTQGQGVAVNADWALGQRVTFNQSLQGRWTTKQTQYSLNAGVLWRIAPQWSLQSSVYAISGNNNSLNLAQSPLAIPVIPPNVTQDTGVYVMLRYDESAGRPTVPLGGPPGTGAGRLTGLLFLDENRNSKREAGELGAANVTVLLDGRFSAQTDNQGKFEFAYVAEGVHVITVISDNLPLPWTLDKEGRTELRVFTRDTTHVEIAAFKLQ